jgi:hypothetical protein
MASSLTPINQNPAQSTKFQLHFDRLPYMTFFCQAANIPGINIDAVPQPTVFVELYTPGDRLHYDTLDIKFIVDEDYRSWQSVHDWIRGLSFPYDFEEYIGLKYQNRGLPPGLPNQAPQYSDAILSIYTNKNNENFKIKFVDCFPVSLTGINLDTENNADTIIYGEASFKFSYYNIERV